MSDMEDLILSQSPSMTIVDFLEEVSGVKLTRQQWRKGEVTYQIQQPIAEMTPEQRMAFRSDVAAYMRQTATPDNPSAGMQRCAAELLETDIMCNEGKPLRLLRLEQVLNKVPVSKATLYREILKGNFPQPVKIFGERASAWLEQEVDEWIQMRLEARYFEGSAGDAIEVKLEDL